MDIKLSVSFGSDPVPIEKRIEGMDPLCDGLYPHEVLVLSYVPYFTDKTKEYQLFWEQSYGIQDVSLIIASLYKKGYFRKGTIAETIKLSTVPILKELLRKRDLKVSGKKDDLIKRIVENIPEDELELIFSEHPYKLTTKGEEILKKYEWVPYLHRNFCEDVDMWDFAKLMEEPPFTDYKEKLREYLVRKSEVLLKENYFGFYRCTISKLYNLAFENEDFEKAFNFLCIITAYDLTYHSNGFKIDMFHVCLNHDLNYDYKPNSSHRVGKYWTEKYAYCEKIFGWTEEELKHNIIHNISKVELPIRLFTPEECGDIIIAEIHEDDKKIKSIYTKAKRNFKKANKKYFQEIEELDRM